MIGKINPAEKLHYSIDEVMELHGLDQWTIRMWIDWFEIPGHQFTANGGILFTPQAVERIGEICHLMKNKMKLKEIRKYIESHDDLEEM